MNSIKTRLADILAEEERSIAWLARKVGVSRQWMGEFVHGHRNPGEANREKIAGALGRTIDEVFPPAAVRCTVNEGQEVPS